jgi:Tfp pilus assembly PilM family ATPase/Tfp pilus assembly protein PilN
MEGNDPVKHTKSILGLHIEDDLLSMVHLKQTANGLHVNNWTAEPLTEGIVGDGLIVDKEIVSQKIRDFVKACRPRPRKAIISLPCSAVRLRPLELSSQTDEQCEKQIQEQVDKYALFGGKEVVFDHCTFRQATQSSGKRRALLAVAARETSDACLEVAVRAGLGLVRVEPAALPIMNLYLNATEADSEAISLLLVLDSALASISVFKDVEPRFCQNLNVGIRDILQGAEGSGSLIEQIKPVLQFARTLGDTNKLALNIAANCEAEKLATLVDRMKESFADVKVNQLDQTWLTKQCGAQSGDWDDVPILALSSALTFCGVCESTGQSNLMSAESLRRQEFRMEMSLTAIMMAAVVLLSFAAIVPLRMRTKSVGAASARMEARIAETTPNREKIDRLNEEVKQLKQEKSTYDAIGRAARDIPWPKILQTIADTVPDEVRIVDISTMNSAEFQLVGESLAESHIYRFARTLHGNRLFESVKVEEIEYGENVIGNVVDYRIACKVRLPGNDS